VKTQKFYVAIITPVIHYCMGGLEVDVNSMVLGKSGPIHGLYAAGEVAGGIHGNNRLGGNSLLDCVVFGRVSGRHAAQAMLGDSFKPVNLNEISGGGLSGEVKASKNAGGAYEDNMNPNAGAAAAGGGGGGYTLEEVAKHNTKASCWVVLDGKVLDVTNFLSEHPGGELAILTFAGKDATEEFNMIHPPDVVGKYAPDAIIGVVGTGGGGGGAVAAAAASAPVTSKDKGDFVANHHAWGSHDGANWRIEAYDDNPGVLIIPVKAYFFAALHLLLAILIECGKTIFVNKNFKISNDRVGLTSSAILLILFMVIHAVGNLHVFLGPDDFNGYGYFYVRLYWTGFGLPANIVEEYILLSALLHVFVALKRTWDMKLKMGIASGQLNLAISGIILLTFMTIHLFQFRFGETSTYYIHPPPYLINFWAILGLRLSLFWCDQSFDDCPGAPATPVRDIYKLEFDIFQRPTNFPFGSSCGEKPFALFGLDWELPCSLVPNFWAGFYVFSVFIFMIHACLGWAKVVPALGIPMGHHRRVNWIGYLIFWTLGAIYISFPAYVVYTPQRFCGWEADPSTPENLINHGATDCTLPKVGN
jgi:predicted heme/steroid binding protein